MKLKQTSCETGGVQDQIKWLKKRMSDLLFDGKNPFQVFDFLYYFVTEAEIIGMSEGHASLAVPHLIQRFVLR